MAAVINLATSSISVAEFLVGTPSTIPVEKKSPRSWSYYVVSGAAIIGAITTIACIVLSQFVIAACTGLLTLASFLAAHKINQIRVMKDLEGYVEELTQKIKVLGASIIAFQRSNADLERINADLTASGQRYQRTIEEENAPLNERLAAMSAQLAKLRSDEAAFKATSLEQAAFMESLQSRQGDQVGEMERLTDENKSLRESVNLLKAADQGLGSDIAIAQRTEGKFDQERAALLADQARASALVEHLPSLGASGAAISAAASGLLSTTRNLGEEAHQLNEGVDSLQHDMTRLEALLQVAAAPARASKEPSPTELV